MSEVDEGGTYREMAWVFTLVVIGLVGFVLWVDALWKVAQMKPVPGWQFTAAIGISIVVTPLMRGYP